MEDFEKQIYSEIEYCHSLLPTDNSIQLKLDLHNLYFLCQILDFKQRPTNFRFLLSKLSDINFSQYYEQYKVFLNNSTLHLYDSFFKDIPIDINKESHYKTKFNIEESIDISIEFLKSFNPNYYNTFKTLKEKLIILNPVHYTKCEFSGTVLGGNTNHTNTRIILLDLEDINTCISLVHEISHAYDFYINRSLSNAEYKRKLLALTSEINSYYTELYFYDYLKKEYPYDIKLCLEDFDNYFFDSTTCLKDFLESNRKSKIKFYKDVNYYIDLKRDYNGRMVAYILYSLSDIEKSNYICNKIMTDIHNNSLNEILLKEGINLEEYSTHEKVFKLIKKHWN